MTTSAPQDATTTDAAAELQQFAQFAAAQFAAPLVKHFDIAKGFAIRMWPDGTTQQSETLEQGDRGFVMAKFTNPIDELETEIPNACLKDGALVSRGPVHRQTDRQTARCRQTDRQIDRQTDTPTETTDRTDST